MGGAPQLFPVTAAGTVTTSGTADAPFSSFNAAGLTGRNQATPLTGAHLAVRHRSTIPRRARSVCSVFFPAPLLTSVHLNGSDTATWTAVLKDACLHMCAAAELQRAAEYFLPSSSEDDASDADEPRRPPEPSPAVGLKSAGGGQEDRADRHKHKKCALEMSTSHHTAPAQA